MNRTYITAGIVILAIIALFFAFNMDERVRDPGTPTATTTSSNTDNTDAQNGQDSNGNTNADGNTIGYVSYSNNDQGFQLLRPSASEVNQETESRIKFSLLGPLNEPNTEITDGFTLTIFHDNSVATSTSLRSYAQSRIESTRATSGEILTDLESRTVNNTSAYRYSFRNMLGSISWEYVFLPQSGDGYTATYTIADPEGEDRGYENIVLNMLESLTFTP